MRILMLALGTRGDLQLLSAFGERLAARGHAVTFASWRDHVERLDATQLVPQAVGRGTAADGRRLLAELAHEADLPQRSRLFLERWVMPELRAARPVLESLARSNDYFVSNLSVQIQRGAEPLPAATVVYDPPEDPASWYRWLESLDAQRLLPLVALPADWLPGEAGRLARDSCTGWWQTAAHATAPLPEPLAAFLARRPRTFALTLGSMQHPDPAALLETMVTAVRAIGGQLVWIGGWSERLRIDPWPEEIYWIRDVDYGSLLPHVRGILHHGGYGTVVAALRAGLPAIVLPQLETQRVFGHWLERQGLAVDTIVPSELTGDRLLQAFRTLDASHTTHQLRSAQRPFDDGGMERGVDALERHAESRGVPHARHPGPIPPPKEPR